jgi:hypothetical protein
MNKKALSLVISSLLLIIFTLAAVLIMWGTIKELITGKTDYAKSCFDLFGKVAINKEYTCYNSTTGELQFSISIGDIDVDEVLVSVSKTEGAKTFKIKKEVSTIENLKYYNLSTNVKLPGKMGSNAYLYNITAAGLSGIPNTIKLAPVINGNQCDVTDTFSDIINCASLA